jgi:hypothetical protein
MELLARACWIIACVIILVVTVAKYDGKPNSDIADFEAWTMLVLSFPLGWLAVALFVGVARIGEYWYKAEIPTSYTYLIIMWGLWFTIGYLQWFMLLPWTIRRLRERSSRIQQV